MLLITWDSDSIASSQIMFAHGSKCTLIAKSGLFDIRFKLANIEGQSPWELRSTRSSAIRFIDV